MNRTRRVLIASSAIVVVAAGAFTVGAVVSRHPGKTTITDSALNLPTLKGLPSYGTESASPGTSRSASPTRSVAATKSAADAGTAAADATNIVPAPPVRTSAASVGAPASKKPSTSASSAASSPVLVGNWLLNQTTGNTAVDSTGAHDGTATDGWWDAGDGFLANGSNSQIYTAGPVVSTGSGRSFSVSAWVFLSAYPVAPAENSTAVSEDTSTDSSFYLQFSYPAGRWAFSRTAANSSSSTAAYRATSTSVPALNTWTHLVGVFDGSTDVMSLYVNGQLQGSTTDPTPFGGTGDFVIGRGQYHGSPSDWWDGDIKKVQAFDSALSPSQVDALP